VQGRDSSRPLAKARTRHLAPADTDQTFSDRPPCRGAIYRVRSPKPTGAISRRLMLIKMSATVHRVRARFITSARRSPRATSVRPILTALLPLLVHDRFGKPEIESAQAFVRKDTPMT